MAADKNESPSIDRLRGYGADVLDAAERFDGNMALYERLALKYLDAERIGDIANAFASGDAEAAFQLTHSLKGVAGNLSFAQVYDAASLICNALRAHDVDAARGHLDERAAADARIRTGLEKLQAGEL